MKALKLVGLLIVALMALAACGTSVPATAPTSAPAAAQPTAAGAPTKPAVGTKKEPKDIKILVDMKGPGGGNPFWAAVEKGATAAGQALGVQVTVLAPPA